MKDLLIKHYNANVENYKSIEKTVAKLITLIGWLRLLVFICIVIIGYYTITSFSAVIFILLLLLIAFFIYLLRLHQLKINKKNLLTNLVSINENEIEQLNYGKSFFDSGKEYIINLSYIEDLDVFGENSIYHNINRTTTSFGKEKLASLLRNPFSDENSIYKQQEAIKEFAQKEKTRQQIIALGMANKAEKQNINQLINWAETKSDFFDSIRMKITRYLFPILCLISLIVSIVLSNVSYFMITFFVNLFVSGMFLKKINKIHNEISTHIKSFSVFSDMLDTINTEKFESAILKNSIINTSEAAIQLKRLNNIGNFFDQRINFLWAIVFNGIFLYDLQCAFLLTKWGKNNGNKLNIWISEIGNIEMLNSLSTYAYNHPDFIYPTINHQTPFLKASNIGHPLIIKEKCISNDIEIGANQKLFLITGSNMSGKSTFLRTIGVNLLFAKCGMPVFATQFECSPLEIYTSLRLSDSLQDNVSLFFAELSKLKYILEQLKSNANAIVLLDEILKGTNSDDKHNGCKQLIKKLLLMNCITIMATHDIELTVLANEHSGLIENYCFESNLINDELSFDYKLRKGISQNRNATFLMKKMGIID